MESLGHWVELFANVCRSQCGSGFYNREKQLRIYPTLWMYLYVYPCHKNLLIALNSSYLSATFSVSLATYRDILFCHWAIDMCHFASDSSMCVTIQCRLWFVCVYECIGQWQLTIKIPIENSVMIIWLMFCEWKNLQFQWQMESVNDNFRQTKIIRAMNNYSIKPTDEGPISIIQSFQVQGISL